MNIEQQLVRPLDMSSKRVAVIGAGVAGISALKACLEAGLDVTCFEQSDHVGGLWKYDESDTSRTSVMKCTLMNTSKELSAFSDFPPPVSFPLFMPHDIALEYLEMYVERFQLRAHINFRHSVTDLAEREDGRWSITVRDADDNEKLGHFDSVLLAVGHHNCLQLPDIVGLEKFKGAVVHSSQYRSSEPFRNKNVLIIGLGSSAGDAATDLAGVAKNVYLSRRRGTWLMSRTVGGYPFDALWLRRIDIFFSKLLPNWLGNFVMTRRLKAIYDPKFLGLTPDHGPLSREFLISDTFANLLISKKVQLKGQVERFTEHEASFKTGELVQVDAIILCTGFKVNYDFIKDNLLLRNVVNKCDNQIALYRNMIAVQVRRPHSLAFIGLLQVSGAVWPVMEMQSRFMAQVILGHVQLPSAETMKREVERSTAAKKERFFLAANNLPCLSIDSNWIDYMDTLAAEIGCKPNLLRYLLTDPKLFTTLMFRSLSAAQYRLEGKYQNACARNTVLTVEERMQKTFNW